LQVEIQLKKNIQSGDQSYWRYKAGLASSISIAVDCVRNHPAFELGVLTDAEFGGGCR